MWLNIGFFVLGLMTTIVALCFLFGYMMTQEDGESVGNKTREYLEAWYKVEYNIDGCMGDDWHHTLNLEGKQSRFSNITAAKALIRELKKRGTGHEYRIIKVREEVLDV